MAGNRRGRLKERFEGIHRNFDWIIEHCTKCLELIAGDNPKLSESIEALAKGTKQLDELAQSIYGSL